MITIQQNSTKQNKKSAKKKHAQADIGTPQVPLRKSYQIKQEYELLSDWEHAS